MSTLYGPAGPGRIARAAWGWLVILALFSFSVPARAQSGANTGGDFGDTPDTTNHDGAPMNAFIFSQGPAANYPTVYDLSQPGPQGPWHRAPRARSWLGADVTREANADLLPDADSDRNLQASTSEANMDGADDALVSGIDLPECDQTSFSYQVSGAAGLPAHSDYVNVWFDFNRDGDWNDTLVCQTARGGQAQVPEWAVANQPIVIAPGLNTFATPAFYSAHQGSEPHVWMRITLAELAIPAGAGDGRGPPDGYKSGETEDYPLAPVPAPATATLRAYSGGGGTTYKPDVAYYYGY